MVELADALRSGRSEGNLVGVRVPPSAPTVMKGMGDPSAENSTAEGFFYGALALGRGDSREYRRGPRGRARQAGPMFLDDEKRSRLYVRAFAGRRRAPG